MNTDILAVLAWLAGPGVAAISAWLLGQLAQFEELSGNGKLIVAVTVAGICGVLATAASQALTNDAGLVSQLQPYANVIVPALSLLAQQLAHGQTLKVERDADDARMMTIFEGADSAE
jgi:hypothetical protein